MFFSSCVKWKKSIRAIVAREEEIPHATSEIILGGAMEEEEVEVDSEAVALMIKRLGQRRFEYLKRNYAIMAIR